MDGTQGRRDVVEEISLKLGVYWVQVPENQIVPGERGRGEGVWTGRSGVESVGVGGGCESAGVWVVWSERDRKSESINKRNFLLSDITK